MGHLRRKWIDSQIMRLHTKVKIRYLRSHTLFLMTLYFQFSLLQKKSKKIYLKKLLKIFFSTDHFGGCDKSEERPSFSPFRGLFRGFERDGALLQSAFRPLSVVKTGHEIVNSI